MTSPQIDGDRRQGVPAHLGTQLPGTQLQGTQLPGTDRTDQDLDALAGRLLARMRDLGSVLVAFSAGADSALVLAAAARALGPAKVGAATAVSASLAEGESAQARAFADRLGVRWLPVPTQEMERAGYRANAGDRCFHCKAELLDRLAPVAVQHGLAHVATGTNADDAVAGFRPGIRAAAERGAVTPLLDAGLTKADVRALSRAWGLPTWNKPAAACLSSRIAYGVGITGHGLARVGRAERSVREVLTGAGRRCDDLRVRDLGSDRARVELDADLLPDLTPQLREDLLAAVTGCGFEAAELDPRGFRSGSMNELLDDAARWR
ncbi:MAG: TIGR00268 family protein [Actinomycetales bacterium]